MLGLGETETEVFQAMDDLREHDVEVLTMGQYLRPTPQHLRSWNTSNPKPSTSTVRSPATRASPTWPAARSSAVPTTPPTSIRSNPQVQPIFSGGLLTVGPSQSRRSPWAARLLPVSAVECLGDARQVGPTNRNFGQVV